VKINWTNPQVDLLKSDLSSSPAKNQPVPPSAAAGQVDEAKFSAITDKVNQLKAQAAAAPEVRQERMDSLRQRVQSGEYKVDARRVAEAMFSDLRIPGEKNWRCNPCRQNHNTLSVCRFCSSADLRPRASCARRSKNVYLQWPNSILTLWSIASPGKQSSATPSPRLIVA
jgi:negative regulator of flagellin synthesis FlgM